MSADIPAAEQHDTAGESAKKGSGNRVPLSRFTWKSYYDMLVIYTKNNNGRCQVRHDPAGSHSLLHAFVEKQKRDLCAHVQACVDGGAEGALSSRAKRIIRRFAKLDALGLFSDNQDEPGGGPLIPLEQLRQDGLRPTMLEFLYEFQQAKNHVRVAVGENGQYYLLCAWRDEQKLQLDSHTVEFASHLDSIGFYDGIVDGKHVPLTIFKGDQGTWLEFFVKLYHKFRCNHPDIHGGLRVEVGGTGANSLLLLFVKQERTRLRGLASGDIPISEGSVLASFEADALGLFESLPQTVNSSQDANVWRLQLNWLEIFRSKNTNRISVQVGQNGEHRLLHAFLQQAKARWLSAVGGREALSASDQLQVLSLDANGFFRAETHECDSIGELPESGQNEAVFASHSKGENAAVADSEHQSARAGLLNAVNGDGAISSPATNACDAAETVMEKIPRKTCAKGSSTALTLSRGKTERSSGDTGKRKQGTAGLSSDGQDALRRPRDPHAARNKRSGQPLDCRDDHPCLRQRRN